MGWSQASAAQSATPSEPDDAGAPDEPDEPAPSHGALTHSMLPVVAVPDDTEVSAGTDS
jgi:hypothetical protein